MLCKPKISTAFFGSSCSGKESKGKLGSGSECSGSASLPFYTVSSTGTGTGGTGTGVTGTGGTVPDEPPASPVDPGSQSQRGHAAEPRKQAQH